MARKNYTVEQIIVKLREVELHCNQGKTITEACRGLEITELRIIDGEKNMVE